MMVRTALKYILIVVGLAILYLSTSKNMMQQISDARNDNDEWWGSHFAYEGDLVGMSYLYYEKKFHKPGQRIYKPKQCDSGKGVNLVIWGDSYTQYFGDTCFCADKYQYGRRYFSKLDYTLDSSKRNILIIESTERLVREYFANNRMANEVKLLSYKNVLSGIQRYHKQVNTAAFSIPDVSMLFNEHINQNIEYNLFNYNFVSPARKMKAWMNYKVFNRASGDAVLSDDADRLFLKETTLKKGNSGYANPLTNEEIDKLVAVFNDLYDRYRNAGFDEVYLSLIPNAVAIYQPENYNMLIPRIQQHASLKMKCIDIYTVFRQHPDDMYWRGDTHWSNKGADEWLKIVNRILSDTSYNASL